MLLIRYINLFKEEFTRKHICIFGGVATTYAPRTFHLAVTVSTSFPPNFFSIGNYQVGLHYLSQPHPSYPSQVHLPLLSQRGLCYLRSDVFHSETTDLFSSTIRHFVKAHKIISLTQLTPSCPFEEETSTLHIKSIPPYIFRTIPLRYHGIGWR